MRIKKDTNYDVKRTGPNYSAPVFLFIEEGNRIHNERKHPHSKKHLKGKNLIGD